MDKHGILKLSEIDNLDDRKEIYYLLTLLSQEERFQFLEFTVKVINQGIVFYHDPPYVLISVTQNTGSVGETYLDLMQAIAKYDIPIRGVVDALVNYVRRLQKLTENHRHEASKVPIERLL